MSKKPSYIFVIGGVISGVGKGVTTSSIAKILQSRGYKVTALKIDPYVNLDAGTMNPTEHGEVFVLSDGDECDQDMGNYERFLNVTLSRDNYMTTGRVYQSVINRERNLGYKGKCVQVVPHVPLEVIDRIKRATEKAQADVAVIEIGGTVGEYENILFLEAARMLKMESPKQVMFVMVSYVPTPSKTGEMKTKPTQHAVRAVNATGIQPDIIIARSSAPLDVKRKEKISLFCNIAADRVVSAPDVESIYDVPLLFEKEKIGERIVNLLGLPKRTGTGLASWKKFFSPATHAPKSIHIAVVGKYFDTGDYMLSDSYISVIEALKYSSYALGKNIKLSWINSKDFETGKLNVEVLSEYDGVLIPGGFGASGVEGKIAAIEYVRQHHIPFFGICYGMQLAVIEYARHVLGLQDAHTTEVNKKTKHPVIDILEEQKEKLAELQYGNTMRLGSWPAVLKKNTKALAAYKTEKIIERHRHRYEVNPQFVAELEAAGVVFSGTSPDGSLVEVMELPEKLHPFFLACQFHPEFLARPEHPHPLFTAFVTACVKGKK